MIAATETSGVEKWKQTLTFSRQDAFKTCRRKHYYLYELGMRTENDARALRMGTNWHRALECLKLLQGLDAAIESVRDAYAELPDAYDPVDWSYECETLERLLCAYVWRWDGDGITYRANEHAFHLPLVNPATGKESTNWEWAGKIDGIIELEDRRVSVMEHKLFGEDLDPSSDLWKRLRVDMQISLYVLAARKMGFDVSSVLYDVTRKPTIKPSPVPILDANGIKIVLDRDNVRVFNKNGAPRQTGDTALGYEIQTRPMTSDEWGEKLTADIQDRPDYYFARVEIARLDQDLKECAFELWDIQKTIRDAQVNDRWYRTCNKNTCGFCAFFSPCTQGWKRGDRTPIGFQIVGDLHPELAVSSPLNPTRMSHAAGSTPATASEESTAPVAPTYGTAESIQIAAQ